MNVASSRCTSLLEKSLLRLGLVSEKPNCSRTIFSFRWVSQDPSGVVGV